MVDDTALTIETAGLKVNETGDPWVWAALDTSSRKKRKLSATIPEYDHPMVDLLNGVYYMDRFNEGLFPFSCTPFGECHV